MCGFCTWSERGIQPEVCLRCDIYIKSPLLWTSQWFKTVYPEFCTSSWKPNGADCGQKKHIFVLHHKKNWQSRSERLQKCDSSKVHSVFSVKYVAVWQPPIVCLFAIYVGPLGNSWFVIPQISTFPSTWFCWNIPTSGKRNLNVPLGIRHWLFFIT